jgi:multidrug efflux pump subunit AcrA (membrane-fusion protein)
LNAQQQVSTDQKAVASAENGLGQLLQSSGSGGAGTSTGSNSSNSSNGSAGSTTPKSSSTTGSPYSGSNSSGGAAIDYAVQLAMDQAAIDSADAQLIQAQQALDDATLVSPVNGTVASVGLSVGQSVGAGSSTNAITIISSGLFEVMSSLTGAQSQQVQTGDHALVTVDGTSGTIDGTVVRVGPVNTSGSSDTYPMVITLSPGSHGIAAGSAAEVQVVLRQATDTLSVPTSAVNTIRSGASYVMVLSQGREQRKPVTVGIVGPQYTQITSGISEGMTVVLADLSQPVPASSTSSNGLGSLSLVGGTGGRFPRTFNISPAGAGARGG